MSARSFVIVTCPVCESEGAMLRHDCRAPLVYSCQQCLHEWQIDPAEEPPQMDSTVSDSTQTLSARGKPPRAL